MENAKVVPATQDLVDSLKGRLRQADKDEVYAMSGSDVDEALQRGFNVSELCWIGMWKDDPVTCFGVNRHGLLSDNGTPWLLGTDRIREPGVKLAFVQNSVPYVLEMMKRFKYLENWVDARNISSIRWLKMCGFTVEAAEPTGFLSLPFHRFWLRR